jgi:hypothetical protein
VQSAGNASDVPAKATPQLLSTSDLTIEQVRSTLQLINKMLRKQAQPAELAALLKIKEVRDILDLHKVNPKESSERINQYQKDLAARLRTHDRSKRSAEDQITGSMEDGPAKKSRLEEEAVTPAPEVPKPKPRQKLTGILAQAELALAPTSIPQTQDFNVEWIQYFFQLMCSRIPFFTDSKLLVPGPARTYVEESEDQRVFVDGLSSREIVLLLNFVYDLEKHLRSTTAKGSIIVPSRAKFLPSMGDPLESGLLEAWYFNSQVQCATCALRFANRKLLTIHHDYHYHKYTVNQRRKKGLENNFRGWMETPGEFIGSKEVQFGFHVYEKLDMDIKDNSFLASVGIVDEGGDVDMQPCTVVSKSTIRASHAARTQTFEQQLTGQVLPHSVPVDEVKNRCLECGEQFESVWIGEPIDMAVFTNVVAIPVGGSTPLQFSWPISARDDQHGVQDVDAYVEDLADKKRIEEYKVQAAHALSDQRYVNAMLFHKTCFDSNWRLTSKNSQMDLLSNRLVCDVVAFLRPPPDVVEAAVIEEVSDDEEAMVV